MNKHNRLEIRDKCFSVHRDSGCLFIRAPERTGYEHILCVEGDKRILASAFDEYVACDVFEHYVLCRDINYLSDQTVGPFTRDDLLNKEIQFVYQNINDSATLQIQAGEELATVTTSVTQFGETKQFSFGDEHNSITFTEQGTKKVIVKQREITVTFVSFETAVYTIDEIFKLGFPEGAIGGLDDISGEITLQDSPPVSNITGMIEEIAAETVLRDTVPLVELVAAVEEFLSELIIVDNNVDLDPPQDVQVCYTTQDPPPTLHGRAVCFDGVDDYLTVSASDELAFGTSDFTIEAWVKADDSDYFTIMQNLSHGAVAQTNDWFFGVSDGNPGMISFNMHGSNTAHRVETDPGVFQFDGQFHHVAFTRTASGCSIWYDGQQVTTSDAFNTWDFNKVQEHTVGYRVTPNYSSGAIRGLRVSGVSLYTTDFLPSTQPSIGENTLLLLDTDGVIQDVSSVSHTITQSGGVIFCEFDQNEVIG